tara:strand:+ start:77 stop:214 length:138 start_codon:yes stop_codon:yes gene_type:complete
MIKVSKLKPQPINLDSLEPLPEQILGKRKIEKLPIYNNIIKQIKL